MAPSRFQEVHNLPTTSNVMLNMVVGIEFDDPRHNCLVAENLNGCTAVVIISDHAAVMANILPRPTIYDSDPYIGDKNMKEKVVELVEFISRHRDKFPLYACWAWVIYAVLDGETGLPGQKGIINDVLTTMGISRADHPYSVLVGRPRPAGQGTVVIDARSGRPEVYIDDLRVN
ncbi:uncharacterized protein GIQ15_05243 [Arthroderma uncinatum]|uniref:uncharacterized protein n=1 Tax=Arthroderma uncinatum TaxID=74035 RepID=UPI00144AD579|nr:uncharacterized protein GIQ15_05243 [Arthroderma uncinatum]KAF3482484.1 hypothetical protein GIQ15_05243 [Arthroderma uncinatum]